MMLTLGWYGVGLSGVGYELVGFRWVGGWVGGGEGGTARLMLKEGRQHFFWGWRPNLPNPQLMFMCGWGPHRTRLGRLGICVAWRV